MSVLEKGGKKVERIKREKEQKEVKNKGELENAKKETM